MKRKKKTTPNDLDFERDTTIDESALDVEWIQQAELTMRYCRHEAEARKALEDAKAKLDIIKAELDQDIRANPEKYGLPKITETAIQNVISASDKCKQAEAQIREANYELNMAQGAVRSIYAKKDALENLVRLHGQQYFAGPSVPRDLSKEWERKQAQQKSNKKVKISQNNNKNS